MTTLTKSVREALFNKYNVPGSFYTSFPPTGLWLEEFTHINYFEALEQLLSNKPNTPLQLYIHYPFCRQQCWYCQCYQLIASEAARKTFLEYLLREIDLLINFFTGRSLKPNFREIHLGGGSPSFLPTADFERLLAKLGQLLDVQVLDEFAIEVDPHTVNQTDLVRYSEQGVTRVSFGVQELNPVVQKAINRIQPLELIEDRLNVRDRFKGINFDLIYGLPLQTRASLQKTISEVMRLKPDRIAFSILGYRPDIFPHNRLINERDLPTLMEKMDMWDDTLQTFLANDYERIGVDYFARKGDTLIQAKANKVLLRDANGYSPGRFGNNLSLGPSGMARVGNFYFQNFYGLDAYYAAIDDGKFPIFRGYRLNRDEQMRRYVMHQIINYFQLDVRTFEQRYQTDFGTYFKNELESLQSFVADSLLEIQLERLTVTPLGTYFLRNICKVFDNLGKEHKHNVETAIKTASCSV